MFDLLSKVSKQVLVLTSTSYIYNEMFYQLSYLSFFIIRKLYKYIKSNL
jgi:hypothetical protein